MLEWIKTSDEVENVNVFYKWERHEFGKEGRGQTLQVELCHQKTYWSPNP